MIAPQESTGEGTTLTRTGKKPKKHKKIKKDFGHKKQKKIKKTKNQRGGDLFVDKKFFYKEKELSIIFLY